MEAKILTKVHMKSNQLSNLSDHSMVTEMSFFTLLLERFLCFACSHNLCGKILENNDNSQRKDDGQFIINC